MKESTLKPAPDLDSRADLKSFDPLESSPQVRLLRDAKPHTIAGMIAAGLLAVILSAIIGHRFGPVSAFQPVADAQRLMDVGNPPPSEPEFPLMRDVVSWYLIVMSAVTLAIVRKQWREISKIVPHLSQAGALHWRERVAGGRLSRRLLVRAAHADESPQEFLQTALSRARYLVNAIGRFWWLIFIIASAVAVGFITGEIDGGFQALAPTHLSSAAMDRWGEEAVASWWAGTDNLCGLFVYFLISALMFSAIAAQNGIGLAAIYLFIAMNKTFHFRCDWENKDGYFGWAPVASLYRLTLLSLTLHIAAITSVMWLMGTARYLYMAVLIVIPVIAIPLYIVVPYIVFRRFNDREKDRRIDELTSGFDRTTALHLRQSLRGELEYVRVAKINPLRPRRRQIPASIATIVIPVALTTVQVIAAINS